MHNVWYNYLIQKLAIFPWLSKSSRCISAETIKNMPWKIGLCSRNGKILQIPSFSLKTTLEKKICIWFVLIYILFFMLEISRILIKLAFFLVWNWFILHWKLSFDIKICFSFSKDYLQCYIEKVYWLKVLACQPSSVFKRWINLRAWFRDTSFALRWIDL